MHPSLKRRSRTIHRGSRTKSPRRHNDSQARHPKPEHRRGRWSVRGTLFSNPFPFILRSKPHPSPSKLTSHLPQMEISAHLHRSADLSVPRKQQSIIKSFAKALEIIPRQLCDNAGFDATNILTQLRVEHRKGNTWAGVDFDNEGVRDNMEAFVWEPSLVKINAVQAATEAACLILSVDETISECLGLLKLYQFFVGGRELLLTFTAGNQESEQPQAPQRGLPPGAAQRAMRGRGRGMPRR